MHTSPSSAHARKVRNRLALAVIALGTATAAGPAAARADDAVTVAVDLPAQPLAASLDAVADDAGLALETGSVSLSGAQAPAITGSYPLDTVLDRLLAGSGLVATHDGDRIRVTGMVPVASADGDGDDAAADPVALEPVMVTGEKLVRRLEDTATSVQVIDAYEIESSSMTDAYDAFQRTANVNLDVGGLGRVGGFAIRGISYNGVTPQSFASSTPLASIFVDGVPVSSAGALAGPLDFWDIDSVEILRGPQSTSQGQSALAGAVMLQTRDPGERFDARFRARRGTDTAEDYAAALGGPLGAGFGGRLSFRSFSTDGPTRNTTRNEPADFRDRYNARAKLGWQAEDPERASIMLSVSRADAELGQAQLTGDPEARESTANDPEYVDTRSDLASLRADFGLSEHWKLTSITGFTTTDLHRHDDYNASAVEDGTIENINDDRTLTQELRAGFGGVSLLSRPLRGVVGMFASERINDSALRVTDGNVTGGQPVDVFLDIDTQVDQSREGAAVFGETEWTFAPRWTLISGIRFDYETLDYAYVSDVSVSLRRDGPGLADELLEQVLGSLAGLPADADGAGNADSSAVLPKLGLRYAFSDDASVGATVQRAYRAGGVSVNFVRGTFNAFDPETTTTGELFLRLALFDRRLRLRANLYYTDWRDQQVSVQLSDDPNDTRTENAGASHLYGGELEADFRLLAGLRGFVSLGYAHTEFDDFQAAGSDYRNNDFPSAPERQGAVGLTWEPGLRGPYAQVDLNYQSNSFRQPDNDPGQTADAYALLNARMGWRFRNMEVYVLGRNLLDRFYLTQRAFGLFQAGDPRTLYAGIDWRWD
ncbi:TonB-dependent receptor [Algiphilus sp.]|uniref:TonB-dependent receptor domain-containing protein n=1 Tax=Algiphilus sp. TaxID=1872431 RepID=UPI0025BE7BC4|nr:TonB-dependent receptor [Algiphilus sp.]MCK5770699.1 TonB-dependent receptor [Algiphilus sp.]